MPTLPLYQMPSDPDAWHAVLAPGGYEWWQIAARDVSGNLRVQLDFFEGDPFSRRYRRAYARYRRWPTRVAPPVPRECAGVRCHVIERERTVWRAKVSYPANAVHASSIRADVRIGPHVLSVQDDGTRRAVLDGLPLRGGGSLFGEFTLAVGGNPQLVESRREQHGLLHVELTADYAVRVSVREIRSGQQRRVVTIDGTATYTHRFGNGPLDH